jgi:tetratricopeptide (TPR) repeat protein
MSLELLLNFSDANQLTVSFDGESSGAIDFQSSITAAELQDVRWYLETYGAQYTADVDDDRADRIAVSLKKIGTQLFAAAFGERSAIRLFDQFLNEMEPGRVLTVSSLRPEILALPWELLHQPGGAYVFNEKPRISIRRKLAGANAGRIAKKFKPKNQLRVLMVVSRPVDAGFIDPRGESIAVLDAIDRHGEDRITVEFLRPGTLAGLTARLEDDDLPSIDILHFDGHGVFDAAGSLAGKSELLKGEGQNRGYLLFEKVDGTQDLVSAERLGELLNQQGLGLVVLSACQSSMYGQESDDAETGAIGSVAARLTQTGVPSVLAMSYSVLVKTTEMLFGAFYENLVRGKGIGESLDNARRSLMQDPERGQRSRGQECFTLRLEDWFVPTLYQSGSDRGMVLVAAVSPNRPPAPNSVGAEPLNAIPEPIAGFFGRRRELWQIERAFTPNPGDRRKETRRMTIAGFGGQGKTALAAEAGRWLVRSGMFEAAVFVDYAAFQGTDGVALAVSTIARDLNTNLIDGAAVAGELARRRVLVILDNLEDLAPAAAQGLLTQAIAWSEAGQSRVLITTRQDDLGHSGYPAVGYGHQLLALKGLGTVAYPEDAIDYFQGLMAVPPQPATLPKRKALIELFAKVDFHPLSIALVAEQLRTRGIVDVIQALDRLLLEVPTGLGKDRCLVASLNLSLERLDAGARQFVRRLGVFEGGAMENVLLMITEFTPEQWQPLRRQLESAGLVRAESLENVDVGVPFLKFHPTLARVLWASLDEEEQDPLQRRHRQRYYALSGYLYQEDRKNPYAARAIAQRELPNLLVAVRGAMDAGEDWAVEFVEKVNRFLMVFGMNGDRKDLTDRAGQLAQSVAVGSQAWYLARSNAGEQLWQSGQPQRAIAIFQEILTGLGKMVSYERCFTLGKLGRCWVAMGQHAQAATLYRQALEELGQLEPSDGVNRLMGGTQADLGNVLTDMGDYGAARLAYGLSLAIGEEQGDEKQQATVSFQLGTLEMIKGNLVEAERRYKADLVISQKLNEPDREAITWHQLGMVYQEAKVWEQAEQAYREAARIREAQGLIVGNNGAATTWNQLAIVCQSSGKPKEAEAWYRKAIEASKEVGDTTNVSKMLSNLANLLKNQVPDRLSEARQLAEEGLAIDKTLDPSAAKIWATYNILAQISIQQGEAAKAKDYRRQSRQSYAAFAGAQQMLKQMEPVVEMFTEAAKDVEIRGQVELMLAQLASAVGNNSSGLINAIKRIWDGVRDEEILYEALGSQETLIVGEILRRL